MEGSINIVKTMSGGRGTAAKAGFKQEDQKCGVWDVECGVWKRERENWGRSIELGGLSEWATVAR